MDRSTIIFGYFFAPRRPDVPTAADIEGLVASNAVFMGMFSGRGLLQEEWPIVCHSEAWRREDWPMPDFGRVDGVNPSIAYRTTYNEKRLAEAIQEIQVSPEEARSLPKDSSFGSVALELYLNRLLP